MITERPHDHIVCLPVHRVKDIRRVMTARAKSRETTAARRKNTMKLLSWLSMVISGKGELENVTLRAPQTTWDSLATALCATGAADLGKEIFRQTAEGD